MQRSQIDSRSPLDCRAREILDRVADKWSLHVIAELEGRTLRFTELKRIVDGISHRVLTATLRNLERDGLVTRTVYPVVPPRVEYTLTDAGRDLMKKIQPLVYWAEANITAIDRARAAYDARADTHS